MRINSKEELTYMFGWKKKTKLIEERRNGVYRTVTLDYVTATYGLAKGLKTELDELKKIAEEQKRDMDALKKMIEKLGA